MRADEFVYPPDPPFDISDVSDFIRSARDTYCDYASNVSRAIDAVESAWRGDAGDASSDTLRTFRRCLDRAVSDLNDARTAVDDYAAALATARSSIDTIRADFTKHWPTGSTLDPCVNDGKCVDHPFRIIKLTDRWDEVNNDVDMAAGTCGRVLDEMRPDRSGLPELASSPIGELPTGGFLGIGVDDELRDYSNRVQQLSSDQLNEWLDWATPDDLRRIYHFLDPEERARLLSHLMRNADPLLIAKIQDGIPAALPDPGDGIGWEAPGGTLFPTDTDGHSWIDDVNQKGYGDCWFDSTLAGVVAADPDWVRNHVRENPNGTVTVTFYDDHGRPTPVTVSADLPTSNGTDPQGLWSTYDGRLSHGSTWPGYVEKAFAQYYHDGNGPNGTYAGIEGDWARHAGVYLTGHRSYEVPTLSEATQALHDGQVVTLSTGAVDEDAFREAGLGNIAPHHAYTLVRIEDGLFQLRNPWGHDHPMPLTAERVEQYFGHYTVAEMG